MRKSSDRQTDVPYLWNNRGSLQINHFIVIIHGNVSIGGTTDQARGAMPLKCMPLKVFSLYVV
jgi:hypothetical protein